MLLGAILEHLHSQTGQIALATLTQVPSLFAHANIPELHPKACDYLYKFPQFILYGYIVYRHNFVPTVQPICGPKLAIMFLSGLLRGSACHKPRSHEDFNSLPVAYFQSSRGGLNPDSFKSYVS